MDYLRNFVSGHFQPTIWIPDIIYLLEALPFKFAKKYGKVENQLLREGRKEISESKSTLFEN